MGEMRNACNILTGKPNIITVIKSRKMRWAEHTARLGEMRNNYSTTGVLKHFTTCYIFTVRGCWPHAQPPK
jgi:hypothetical protein